LVCSWENGEPAGRVLLSLLLKRSDKAPQSAAGLRGGLKCTRRDKIAGCYFTLVILINNKKINNVKRPQEKSRIEQIK
jgi:hypothetical protein